MLTDTTASLLTTPGSAPAIPRLKLESTGSARTLLDGGWWPHSTDPAAELPGLVLAIDAVRGPIIRLVLSVDGWNPRPRRLVVAGRVLRLGYFASQPATLLTARCDDGGRVDLLVVPPATARPAAEAAMALAATAGNRIHAPHLLTAPTGTPATRVNAELPEQVWETEGGHLHTVGAS